eukprot:GFKZ01007308.1.p1 GENE.GFKZ01007308.1~~GFKZ01007308.1.p1  ORF type:complete len:779 (-),score=116.94 GFKZ01007308.1:291-2627(-)
MNRITSRFLPRIHAMSFSSAIPRVAFIPGSPVCSSFASTFSRGGLSGRPQLAFSPRLHFAASRSIVASAKAKISVNDNGILDEVSVPREEFGDVGFAEASTEVLQGLEYGVEMPDVDTSAESNEKGKRVSKDDSTLPEISDFRVSPETVKRLAANGITHATEVQAGTFDLLFDGSDVIAKSRTGTGKTLAFALPILERLAEQKKQGGGSRRRVGPGCIVLAPTRELAKQVSREMKYIGDGLGVSVECFYGGSPYGPQENALRKGVDVVVGTPGRIMDHLNRDTLRLNEISFAVLDEADEMLSMGFSQDVEYIFETLPPPEERQVILFSATVPKWVRSLASQFQKKDVVTFDSVATGSMAATTVRHCAVRVPERNEARAALLADIIAVHSNAGEKEAAGPSRAIVFCQTKREADELATSGSLDGCGAAVLHGDVSQQQREVTLAMFRQGRFQVLVATDVAARGLDISGVDVVVQFRVPRDAESYVHRAGRTGRAGKSGTAVVMYSDREARDLKLLERECRVKFELEAAPAPEAGLEAAVRMAMQNVGSVEERVLEHLLPRAEAFLADGGEHRVRELAGLLAMAARRVSIEDRSALSGEAGMRTVIVSGERDITPGLVLRFISDLGRTFEQETRVGLIRMCQDGRAVVDVTSGAASALVEASRSLGEDAEVKLNFAMEVPALRDDRDMRRGRGRGGGYGRDRDRYGDRDRRGGGGRYESRGRFDRDRGRGRGRDNWRDREEYGGGYGGRRGDGYGRRDSRGGGGYRNRDRRQVDFLSDDF